MDNFRMVYYVSKIIRPTTGKIILFSLLIFVILMLPVYPVKNLNTVESHCGNISSTLYYSNEPLALIMLTGYEWTEVSYFCPCCGPFVYIHKSADPAFMPAYITLFILGYVFSGYLSERARWQWKGRFTPYARSI